MTLYEQVAAYIERFELLEPRQELVVAVSGGADSQCLLDCLAQLSYRPIVAHLDHALRPDSHQEALAVAKHAAQRGWRAVIEHLEPGELAASQLSIEHAARLARYRFLVNVAQKHNLRFITTGHTADDQAETVLMHILRGTGTSGLRGMLPRIALDDWSDLPGGRGMSLVRPLLGVTHQMTVAHCEEMELSVIEDESNLDLDLTRNRIRHELLPLLETFNPAIRATLVRLADIMRVDFAWQEMVVDTLWPHVITGSMEEGLEIDLGRFAEQPEALRRAMLRRGTSMLLGAAVTPELALIDRLQSFLIGPKVRRALDLPGGGRAERSGGRGRIFLPPASLAGRKYPQLASVERSAIQIPGEADLLDGWQIRARYERQPGAGSKVELATGEYSRVHFDPGIGQAKLEIRGRLPGDRIRVLGLGGSQKVSDLMINRKLPAPLRARWPLLIDGDEVLWVAGLAQAERTRIPENSEHVLVLELIAPVGEAPDRMDHGG